MLRLLLVEMRKIRAQSGLFVTPSYSKLVFIALLATTLLTGCSNPKLPSLEALPGPTDLPFIHKIDIQQGNVITQEMVGQLRRGMDKKKILFIMGTPIIKDTFNDQRWDYVYTLLHGGGHVERRNVSLVFVDEQLDHITGDIVAASGELIIDTHQDMTVEVPLYFRKSILTRMKNKIPFTEETKEDYVYDIDDVKGREDDEESGDDAEAEDNEKVAEDTEKTEDDKPEETQIASAPEVLVPRDAPTSEKKKGFFRRIFDGIGLGTEDDEPHVPGDYDPGDPKYRDITNPENL